MWENLTHKHAFDLLSCMQGCRGSWLVSLQGLTFILERSWKLGEVPNDWRKANVVPILEKKAQRETWLISLIAAHVEIHVLLERFSGHRKEKVIGSRQHAFTKGESCLTNLITFCSKTSGFIDEG